MSLELYRTFDIHELLPDLDAGLVDRKVRELFRDLIDKAFAKGVVWPGGTPPEYRDSTGFNRLTEIALGMRTWSTKISDVLKTPRALKFFERSVVRQWDRLQGEVSLGELMAIEAIRVCATASFDEIMYCVRELSESQAAIERDSTQVALKEYHDEVSRRLGSMQIAHLSELEREVIRSLAKDLSSGHFSGESPKQSISERSHGERYFRKLSTNLSPSETAITDQEVLRDLKLYVEGGDPQAIAGKIVQNNDYRHMFEHFEDWLRQDWGRATLLFATIVDMEYGKFKYGEEREHAWFPIWRMMSRESSFTDEEPSQAPIILRDYGLSIDTFQNQAKKLEWVASLVFKAIRRSLVEMNDLSYYLSGDDTGIGVLRSVHSAVLREAVYNYLKENMRSPENWIVILEPGAPYQLYHLFFHVASRNQIRSKNQPQDWAWAIPDLVAAAEQRPEIVQPTLVMLVSKEAEGRPRSQSFSIDVLRGFCMSDEVLMRRYATTISRPLNSTHQIQPKDMVIIQQVQEGARSYLAQNTQQVE